MSKEQDLASLGKTAALLPAQEAAAITALAARAPESAERLHQKLISELGYQALVKEQPEKAGEMQGYGNNRGSIGEQLAAVIKKENRSDLSADERGKLADAVAAASGMDKAQVFAKLQAAAVAPAGADAAYKEFQEKIDTKMGAAIASTAASKKEAIHMRYEDFRQNGDSAKPYTPPALDPQVKKELAAVLDIKFGGQGLSDKQKSAVMTIAEASPDYAKGILDKAKALAVKADEITKAGFFDKLRLKAGLEQSQEELKLAIQNAAVDYTIKSGGNNGKVVDALVELAPQMGRDANKDNLSKWLKGAAAAKVASDKRDAEIASLAADDPRRAELERQRDEAKKAQEKNSNSIGDLLSQPGGMLMLFVGIILSALTGKDMITPMLGGGREEGQGQGQGQVGGTAAPAQGKPLDIRYVKDDSPSRVEGEVLVLSKADQAKIAAFAKKNNLADDKKALDALIDEYQKANGGKKATAADLLKMVQTIDAQGGRTQTGPGASVPAPAAEASAPAAAAAAPAPETGGASYLTKIKVKGVEGVTEIDAETLQKALRASGKDLGAFGKDGVDGKAGDKTATALLAYRNETGKHRGDASLTIHADELDSIRKLAESYDKKRSQQAMQENGERTAGILAAHGGGWQGRTAQSATPGASPAPAMAAASSEVEVRINRGTSGDAVSKEISTAQWKKLAELSGDLKPGQTKLEINEGNATEIVAKARAQFQKDHPGRVAGNVADILVAYKKGENGALVPTGEKAPTHKDTVMANAMLATIFDKKELASGGKPAREALSQFQKDNGLEDTGGALNEATRAALSSRSTAVLAERERAREQERREYDSNPLSTAFQRPVTTPKADVVEVAKVGR